MSSRSGGVRSWTIDLTAVSSIVHVGDSRGLISLLRRETIITPVGDVVDIPLVSGNAFRGRLRRTAATLFTRVLDVDGTLTLPAAHALWHGGSLTKTNTEPLTGRRRAELRDLIPPLGIFGAAIGDTMLPGCLSVGKVIPHLAETAHITSHPSSRTADVSVAIEELSRIDDIASNDDTDAKAATMRYAVETFPAGTQFTSWVKLTNPTPIQASFFGDVLAQFFTDQGPLGGRASIGHGLITGTATPTHEPEAEPVDWAADIRRRRDDIVDALTRDIR